jgi:hypothetical protein
MNNATFNLLSQVIVSDGKPTKYLYGARGW